MPLRISRTGSRRLRRAAWIAPLALAGALLCLAGCFLDPQIARERTRREALDHFAAGRDLEDRGEYKLALDEFLRAIEISPRAAFYYHAGQCHGRLGAWEQAIQYYDEALRLAPDYELARAERDLAEARLKLTATPAPSQPPPGPEAAPAPDAPTAAEEIRRAIFPELTGDSPPPAPEEPAEGEAFARSPIHLDTDARRLIELSERAGRLDQAAFYLEKEVKASPADWGLRLRLARALTRTGRLSRAEAELREASQLAPGEPDVWHEWSAFYIRQSEWGEAERCVRECLRLDPEYFRARNNLGVILLRLGRWQEAREEFLALTTAWRSEFASPWLNLAIIEERYTGDLERAIACCDEYLRLEGPRKSEVARWREALERRRAGLPPAPSNYPYAPARPPRPAKSKTGEAGQAITF